MYIWIGINTDIQLSALKAAVYRIEQDIGFQHSNFTLPFHISLKMPFPVEESIRQDMMAAIGDNFQATNAFEIPVLGLDIVWLRMAENERLNQVCDTLNDLLQARFYIDPHEYDRDHQFHTTLFMDADSEKIERAYAQIKDISYPQMLIADTFVIGRSNSGQLGTFELAH